MAPQTKDVANCLELLFLENQLFQTDDAYKVIPIIQRIYPNNQNMKAKIRQQLQILRDMGWIAPISTGLYRWLGQPQP